MEIKHFLWQSIRNFVFFVVLDLLKIEFPEISENFLRVLDIKIELTDHFDTTLAKFQITWYENQNKKFVTGIKIKKIVTGIYTYIIFVYVWGGGSAENPTVDLQKIIRWICRIDVTHF